MNMERIKIPLKTLQMNYPTHFFTYQTHNQEQDPVRKKVSQHQTQLMNLKLLLPLLT